MTLKQIIDFQDKLDEYLITQQIIPFEYEARKKVREEKEAKRKALSKSIIPSEKNDPELQKPRNKK